MFLCSTGYYVSPPLDQYLKFKNCCSLMYVVHILYRKLRHTDIQTDRHTGGQTDRYGGTDGQAAGKQAVRQSDKQTERQTGRRTARQTEIFASTVYRTV